MTAEEDVPEPLESHIPEPAVNMAQQQQPVPPTPQTIPSQSSSNNSAFDVVCVGITIAVIIAIVAFLLSIVL